MKAKIIIIGTILLLTIGITAATEISDFKLNDGYTKKSTNLATKDNFELTITKYTNDYNSLFENDKGYTVITANNITNYTDTEFNTVGCLEIVESNGEKIVIGVQYNNNDNSKIQECYDTLLEFNKNNNLQPINNIG